MFFRWRCVLCGYRLLTMRARKVYCPNHDEKTQLVPVVASASSAPRFITAARLAALLNEEAYGDVFPKVRDA